MEYDLTQIWPYLPLTRGYLLKRDGVLSDIGSVISILDPVDRIDPLDMWDENDEEGALVVYEDWPPPYADSRNQPNSCRYIMSIAAPRQANPGGGLIG